ncbi:MAG TPA: oligoendopeptidase F [Chthoniobacteraceae bacterium]|jgi:oligoendopeptidase F|nr:oligoendopeptidase F [Chthoniobacteraceae bacterium]
MKPSIFFLRDDEAAAAARIPERSEVAAADTWDLTILYATPENWAADFARLQEQFPKYAEFKGRIGKSAADLHACLEFDKEVSVRIERLYHYASLLVSGDSSNAVNLKREGQLQNLLTKIGEISSFMSPEIQALDDTTFDSFLADPLLEEWQISLRKIRRLRPHTLSEAEERLLALGASAIYGHHETFSQLTNVDMKFGVVADEKGVERALSQSSYSSFMVNRDPSVRKTAFHQFYAEFKDHSYTLASSLAHSVRADVFNARARHYPSARAAALFRDDMPPAVYDNLIATVRANLAPLFRYFQLRRRVLKLDEIHLYDTTVPLVSNLDMRTPFNGAVDMVIDSLAPLGAEYTRVLADGLRDRRWCDRYENRGKRSGAFSSSSYGNPPFMLMNYKEDVFSDIYTLTHESGHSMHSWFSQSNQLFQNYDYPIFLAEVASTFNEELLTHYLLEKTGDPRMRAYLINRQVDDIRGTVYRQTMFAEFEKIIHEMEEAGEALTLDAFRSVYRGLLDAYFGPDFALDSELEIECLRIPHFYSAFYVYKYSTGMSAAVSLSQAVLHGGQGAVDRYLGFLKSGGSRFPLPTLDAAGVDMASPAPIEKTLQLFAQRVEELETLLE